MKSICIFILSLISTQTIAQDSLAIQFSQIINKEDLKAHLTKFSSDAFEGREAGRLGQRLAGTYLANMFEKYGIEKYKDSTYFQRFSFEEKRISSAYIKIDSAELKSNKDFYLIPRYSVPKKHTIGKPKIIKPEVFLNSDSLLEGKEWTVYLEMDKNLEEHIRKLRLILRHGIRAKAKTTLLVVSNIDSIKSILKDEWEHSQNQLSSLSEKTENEYLALLFSKEQYQKYIGKLKSSKKDSASFYTTWNKKTFYTENIIGFVHGNKYANEYIVISAHYDHMGKKGNQIYNGADDDGTGTMGILLIAKAISEAKKNGVVFDKHFVFIGMSAEEKGLLGSRYYTENPFIPLERTCTNLNIDMIGRTDMLKHEKTNYLYIIGSNMIDTALHNVNHLANEQYSKLYLDYRFNNTSDPNQFYYRSDHYNFAKNNIPVVFYFRGVHEDYHKPSDTVDKIEWDIYTKITKHIFYTAWTIGRSPKILSID